MSDIITSDLLINDAPIICQFSNKKLSKLEYKLNRRKEYYLKNKDKIIGYNKKYTANKVKDIELSSGIKVKLNYTQAYYLENKNKCEYNSKTYYSKNKEKILNNNKEMREIYKKIRLERVL